MPHECSNPLFNTADRFKQEQNEKKKRELEHQQFLLNRKTAATAKRLQTKAKDAKSDILTDEQKNEGRKDLWASYNKWDIWQTERNYEDKRAEIGAKESVMEEAMKQRAMQMGCHDKSKERAVFELSTEKKLAACRSFQREGRTYYREGQFFRAAAAYRKVIVYLNYTFPEEEPQRQVADTLRQSSLSNLAACKLKTGHFAEAIEFCNQVLSADPDHAKALLRRARANRNLHHYDTAMRDLKRILAGTPKNAATLRELETLRLQIKGYRSESRRVSAAMFGQTPTKSTAACSDDGASASTKKRRRSGSELSQQTKEPEEEEAAGKKAAMRCDLVTGPTVCSKPARSSSGAAVAWIYNILWFLPKAVHVIIAWVHHIFSLFSRGATRPTTSTDTALKPAP